LAREVGAARPFEGIVPTVVLVIAIFGLLLLRDQRQHQHQHRDGTGDPDGGSRRTF
jgi:preprotein translocase subunit YajC